MPQTFPLILASYIISTLTEKSLKMRQILLFFLFLTSLNTHAQSTDWLKKTEADGFFTSHSFHNSVYFNGHYYWTGDFWKDIYFDDLQVSLEEGVDIQNGFMLKTDEDGNAVDLWHFASSDYLRITDMEVNPVSQTLILAGYYRTDMTFNDFSVPAPNPGEGFIMEINEVGQVNWFQKVETLDDFSSSGANTIGIDSQGNIYAAFSTFGNLQIGETVINTGQENIGNLIVKFDVDGNILNNQHWIGTQFESFVDVLDIEILSDDRIIFAGEFFREFSYADEIMDVNGGGSYAFIIVEDGDLNPVWADKYLGTATNMGGVLVDNGNILVNLAYNTNLTVNDEQINGTGTWREMAIALLDKDGGTIWLKNFTLSVNGGNSSVAGREIVKMDDNYWIGGLYQGWVEHENEIILSNQNPEFSNFQFPFILALDTLGNVVETHDFTNSQGPGQLNVLATNGSEVVFGGEFSTRIQMEEEVLETTNSTLFYGGLKNVTTSINVPSNSTEKCDFAVQFSANTNELIVEHRNASIAEIFDVSGRKVRSFNLESGINSLNVSELVRGAYFLRLDCEYGAEVFSFVR